MTHRFLRNNYPLVWKVNNWDLDPDTWQENACDAAGRNFSLFEWQRFFPDDPYRVTCPQWPSGLGG